MVIASERAVSQEPVPRILLTPFALETSDTTTAPVLAETISRTLRLTLLLADAGEVSRAAFLRPHLSLSRAGIYFQRESVSRAVYGVMDHNDEGKLRVTIGVWREDRPDDPDRFERVIESAFAVFGLADELALEIASSIVGRDLAFGQLTVEGADRLGAFSVYADGQLLGRNSSSFQLIAGERAVTIAVPGALGDEPVQTSTVTVPVDGSVTVAVEAEVEVGDEEREVAEADDQTLVQRGTLQLESTPTGATVLLDDEVIGATPLELVGVPVGKYELVMERDYFTPAVAVAEVTANRTSALSMNLSVNPDDPDVAPIVGSPSQASIVAGITAGSRVLITLLPGLLGDPLYNGRYLPMTYNMAIVGGLMQAGHAYAGSDLQTALVAGTGVALGVAALALDEVYQTVDHEATGGAWGWTRSTALGLAITSMVGTALYDIVAAPAVTEQANARTFERISETGMLPEAERLERRIILESGAGALAATGYRMPVLGEAIFLRASAGASVGSLDPFVPGAAVRVQADYVPFGSRTGSLRPYLLAGAQLEYAAEQLGTVLSYGFGVSVLTPLLDLFLASRFEYPLYGAAPPSRPVIGVRL